MAEKMRYNKIIDLLERGKPVFSTSTVPNGNLDDLTYIADADYDAVVIEMEHEGFSFSTLRTSLQVLLNRKRIAEKGNLQPDVVPLVRIPPNGRERNQWVIKQALDTGVYGLVLPPRRHGIPRCRGRRTSNRRGSAVGATASPPDTGA
jgi:4-hydroxy-2-oxoheptanedioate aldolase